MSLFSTPNRRASRARKSALEALEDRALLSVAPYSPAADVLDPMNMNQAAFVAEQSRATNDVEPIKVTQELLKTKGVDDPYNLEYILLESGNVSYLGQNGMSRYQNMTYSAVPDQVYIELWEQAIARWEQVFSVGQEDVVYPYAVNETTIEVDDCLLFFGFTDSYESSSSLGSAINAGYYRNGGSGTAATGSLVFNAKYFTSNPSENLQKIFYNTALHEIGHSLGYNVTHFRQTNLIVSSTDAPFGLDSTFATSSGAQNSYWFYVGERGVAKYLETYPATFTALGQPNNFPMETYIANGSYGAHPSSALSTYFLYLNQRDGMNYAISANYDATITPMTLAVLEDMGYSVNYDYADPIGTAAPDELAAETRGATVILTWNATTSAVSTYDLERMDLTADEPQWSVIATDVDELRYVDVTADPAREYAYRVRATNLTTRDEVADFRVQPNETITWEKGDAVRFTIYTLTHDSSDRLAWTRKVQSTEETSWTADVEYETIARVIALNVVRDQTENSRPVDVSFAQNADQYVPEGYNVEDWNALKAFLEIKDEDGVKNGDKIANAFGDVYSPDMLEELAGLVWKNVDGEMRVTEIEWRNYGLVGALNLPDCDQLAKVDVAKNSLTGVELNSQLVTELNVDDNNLSTLELANLPELRSLSCARNKLANLDFANTPKLTYLNCASNPLAELDLTTTPILVTLRAQEIPVRTINLAGNSRVADLALWNTALEAIYLPEDFAGVVDFADSNAQEYRWTVDELVVGTESSLQFDGAKDTRVATLTLTDATQIVNCYVGEPSQLDPAPSEFVYADYDPATRTLPLTWSTVDAAAQYEVQYKRADSLDDLANEWKLAEIVESNSRIATGVNATSYYLFRVRAIKSDGSYTLWSDELIFKAEESTVLLETPKDFSYGLYDYNAKTLPLTWTAVEGATGYEAQYKRADSEDWSGAWALAEIVDVNERTATRVDQDSYFLFRVRALGENGAVSEWSDSLAFKAAELETLDAPTNLQYANYDRVARTLEMSWDAAKDALFYEVQYRRADNDGEWSDTWNKSAIVAATSRVATLVHEDSYYQFRIRSIGVNWERSQWSETLTFNDQPTVVPIDEINVQEYDPASSTLTFVWTDSPHVAQYETQFRRAVGSAELIEEATWEPIASTSTNELAIQARLDYFYQLRVRIISDANKRSEWLESEVALPEEYSIESTALLDAVFEELDDVELEF